MRNEGEPGARQRLPVPSDSLSGDKGHQSISPSVRPSINPSIRPSLRHSARSQGRERRAGATWRCWAAIAARPFPEFGIPSTRHSRGSRGIPALGRAGTCPGLPSPAKKKGHRAVSTFLAATYSPPSIIVSFTIVPAKLSNSLVLLLAFHTCAGWGQRGDTQCPVTHKDRHCHCQQAGFGS